MSGEAVKGYAYPPRSNDGATNEWYTPPEIFTALGLSFDLDPCAPDGGVPWIPAAKFYSAADDGLTMPWEGRVWMNPPYGRNEIAPWIDRFIDHANGIALVFSRTDTAWWQRLAASADAVTFVPRRIRFVPGGEYGGKGHNAVAPSTLAAFGSECAAAIRKCGLSVVANDERCGHHGQIYERTEGDVRIFRTCHGCRDCTPNQPNGEKE